MDLHLEWATVKHCNIMRVLLWQYSMASTGNTVFYVGTEPRHFNCLFKIFAAIIVVGGLMDWLHKNDMLLKMKREGTFLEVSHMAVLCWLKLPAEISIICKVLSTKKAPEWLCDWCKPWCTWAWARQHLPRRPLILESVRRHKRSGINVIPRNTTSTTNQRMPPTTFNTFIALKKVGPSVRVQRQGIVDAGE